ncbi:MAG: 16S rRNA (adenine(1518)-N(6)/adenine(1519)-N(6))-dimethyltransferase RsmA [Clostridia bacterium]|nr:16S rRNA (adenine(1518)-N(6)/adenine(1519)-N(6))-dimethyltransferase RsmA [Clostridia bacterium]
MNDLKIATPSKTREIIREYNIRLNKRLGQNFLVDPEVARRISLAACEEGDEIIEIGPGIGSLTEQLLSRVRRVVAVEIDSRLIEVLKEIFKGCGSLTVIEGNVLHQDLDTLHEKYTGKSLENSRYNVVGNLPYYITTPILFHLFESTEYMDSATLMMQKEVGDRITASHGSKEYGSLTIACQYYSQPEIITRVSRRNFYPQPEVESMVLKFNIRKKPPVDGDKSMLFSVVRAAFNQRRKTILNALNNYFTDITKNELALILGEAGIDTSCRGEDLSLEEFAAVSNLIYEGKGAHGDSMKS